MHGTLSTSLWLQETTTGRDENRGIIIYGSQMSLRNHAVDMNTLQMSEYTYFHPSQPTDSLYLIFTFCSWIQPVIRPINKSKPFPRGLPNIAMTELPYPPSRMDNLRP